MSNNFLCFYRYLNNVYFYGLGSTINNTYHSFIIRMFLLSEILMFLTLFVIFIYFKHSTSTPVSSFFSLNSFNYNPFCMAYYFLLLLVILSFLLLSIKGGLYLLKSLVSNNISILIFIDFLLTMLILSFCFAFLQYFELILQSSNFFDSSFLGATYSLLILHCFHVLLGFLFFLFLFYNSYFFTLYYNIRFFYFFQLILWYWHLIDFIWLFIIIFIYIS